MTIYQLELATYRRDSRRSIDGYRARKRKRQIDGVRVQTIPRSVWLALAITPLAIQSFV